MSPRVRVRTILVPLLLAGLIAANAAAQVSSVAPKKSSLPEPRYKVGDIAPDFTLKDQNGKEVSLHEFRGKKNVVLAFYVFAFSGG